MVGEAIDLFGDPQPGSGARFDLVLAINITHISPVEATEGLFAGANRLLRPGTGRLVLYGRSSRTLARPVENYTSSRIATFQHVGAHRSVCTARCGSDRRQREI